MTPESLSPEATAKLDELRAVLQQVFTSQVREPTQVDIDDYGRRWAFTVYPELATFPADHVQITSTLDDAGLLEVNIHVKPLPQTQYIELTIVRTEQG